MVKAMQKVIKNNWVIGNWKSNPSSLAQAKDLAKEITAINFDATNGQIMVMPTNLHLSSIVDEMKDSKVLVGCQDVSFTSATTGAYTGDCSAEQMQAIGAKWTLVGHSERRTYHQESDKQLIAKIENALKNDIGVVLCIGETLTEYEKNQTLNVLQKQLAILKEINELENNIDKLIVAYEPVWAIGTGKVPQVAEVENVHKNINEYLLTINTGLTKTPILYGGSVNADNVETFAKSDSIDGVLVGGASLVADKFATLAKTFFATKK